MTQNLDSGICMKGNGDAFARALDLAPIDLDRPFVYVEIGLGAGQTFGAIPPFFVGERLTMVGVDRPRFNYESMRPIREAFPHCDFFFADHDSFFGSWLRADFVFIDGCHCYDCAKADFLGVEKILSKGGVIALHDCGIPEQGTEDQYGHGPIGVRKACEDLGLVPCTRPGWKLLEETNPYSQGGRACLFLQKI